MDGTFVVELESRTYNQHGIGLEESVWLDDRLLCLAQHGPR